MEWGIPGLVSAGMEMGRAQIWRLRGCGEVGWGTPGLVSTGTGMGGSGVLEWGCGGTDWGLRSGRAHVPRQMWGSYSEGAKLWTSGAGGFRRFSLEIRTADVVGDVA